MTPASPLRRDVSTPPATQQSRVLPVDPDQPDAAEARAERAAEAERLARERSTAPPRTLFDRAEAFVSRLSTKNNFWHRVCSLVWLPFAFRSGIKMQKSGESTYSAVLPFRRFNKNWYNAMAGAALLGNSEIAGGMYVFGIVGGDYTVVCKHLEYRFLRPCFGPAEYRITPREPIEPLVAQGGEFNCTLDMEVFQALPVLSKRESEKADRNAERAASGDEKAKREARMERLKNREKRVGKVTVTFHVTPKAHQKAKGRS